MSINELCRKHKAIDGLVAAAMIWGLFTLAGVPFGVLSGLLIDKECSSPPTRLGLIIPGFRIGCWLGSVP